MRAQWQVVQRLGWVSVRYGKSGASVVIGTNHQEADQAAYWLNHYGGAK